NLKDKNAKQRTYYNIQPYLHGTTSGVGIYVDDSHVTHGILFKGVDVFDQQTDGISIFKNGIHQNIDPNSTLEQTEKEKLSPLFEEVLKELKLDKDGETGKFEAGKLDRLSLDLIQQRRLTGIVVKHQNEWKKGRSEDFRAVCEMFEKYGQQAESDWIKQRASNLEIALEVGQFSTSKEAYYFHPLGLVGWLAGSCPENCKTEVIKFKLDNGDYYIVSKDTLEFILQTEGYEKYPYVPGADSGITIGYGYDLGQQNRSQIAEDLSGLYSTDEIKLLQSVSGLKAQKAKSALPIVSKIATSKETAIKLSAISKARYAQSTFDIWPEVIKLHPHCQGALLSIVYNRGNGLKGERRIEMRNIQNHLKSENYEQIPEEIVGMKRLWLNNPDTRGLLIRRDKEAMFFKQGLECNCYE
ncbi:phage lysozyme-like predicted toxin, partial [Cricetibacter osteomyelitidis]